MSFDERRDGDAVVGVQVAGVCVDKLDVFGECLGHLRVLVGGRFGVGFGSIAPSFDGRTRLTGVHQVVFVVQQRADEGDDSAVGKDVHLFAGLWRVLAFSVRFEYVCNGFGLSEAFNNRPWEQPRDQRIFRVDTRRQCDRKSAAGPSNTRSGRRAST